MKRHKGEWVMRVKENKKEERAGGREGWKIEKVKQKEHRKRERKPKRVLVVWLCRCIRTFTSIMLISV